MEINSTVLSHFYIEPSCFISTVCQRFEKGADTDNGVQETLEFRLFRRDISNFAFINSNTTFSVKTEDNKTIKVTKRFNSEHKFETYIFITEDSYYVCLTPNQLIQDILTFYRYTILEEQCQKLLQIDKDTLSYIKDSMVTEDEFTDNLSGSNLTEGKQSI